MQTKNIVLGLVGLIGFVVVGAVGWWLASPLFIDDAVDEEFPTTAQIEMPSEEEIAAMSEEEKAAAEAEVMEAAASMPDKEMDDPMPVADTNAPVALLSGQFTGADNFHQGSGAATIYQLPDGGHVLRFEDFNVTNGPDLHVLLAKHPNPAGRSDLESAGYIDLGQLKGNVGNQNYDIPTDIDLSEYQSVVIYCQPFHVLFASAPVSG